MGIHNFLHLHLSSSFSRSLFQNLKSFIHQALQGGLVNGLPDFDLFQRPQHSPAHAAGAMRPIRVNGDALETREQQSYKLNLVGRLHSYKQNALLFHGQARRADSKSAKISSTDSIPTDKRTRSSGIPTRARSLAVNVRWEDVAGCSTRE